MRKHQKLSALVLSTATLALAGRLASAQRTPQSGAASTYRLVEVNGRPLPVLLEEEQGCREELLSATLTLEPNSRWTLRASKRELCGDRVEPDDDTEEGMYTVTGQEVRFNAPADNPSDTPDPGEIEVEDLSVGTLTADGIRVRLKDGRTLLTFRR